MSRRRFDNGADWIARLEREDVFREPPSDHFDMFKGFPSEGMRGRHVLDFGLKLMIEVELALASASSQLSEMFPLLVFPLGTSNSVVSWENREWDSIGSDVEPPSIYLLGGPLLLDPDDEHHIHFMDLPGGAMPGFQAFYRCHRDARAALNSWEFARSVYVLRDSQRVGQLQS